VFSQPSKIILPKTHTAEIVDWDDQKGYGFLQLGDARVFLHRREFAKFHKRPKLGDKIEFALGLDSKGRTCAKDAEHFNDGGLLTPTAILALLCLLLLPAAALFKLHAPWLGIAAYFVPMNFLSYALYASDKKHARRAASRISERTLHLAEFLGGWAGAFIAQRRLRHKCSKRPFLFVFWTIVFAYQLVAVDCLLEWAIFKNTFRAFKALPAQLRKN
jgi:uncharacterized membrane protein YsdA (DUF1294 family)/cold shock CspA family protein